VSDPDQPAPLTSAQVQAWLGSPRFARYTGVVGGDEPVALRLYQWNAQMAAAALVDVGHFEVALRNAYDGQLSARSRSGPWIRPRRCFIRCRAVVPRGMSSGGWTNAPVTSWNEPGAAWDHVPRMVRSWRV